MTRHQVVLHGIGLDVLETVGVEALPFTTGYHFHYFGQFEQLLRIYHVLLRNLTMTVARTLM